jgi:orotate phosphoribosyltransferase
MAYDRNALIGLIKGLALEFGAFTLTSGETASFYLDCRKVTLHPQGANLIAEGILELLGDQLPDAIGGMAIGADPITAAVITVAGQRDLPLRGFIVRKEPKAHGKGRDVEGPIEAGDTAIIVEDTTTTGGSSIKAIEKAEAAGIKVQAVVSIVDRLAGAADIFAARGYEFRSLLTIRDLGIEP